MPNRFEPPTVSERVLVSACLLGAPCRFDSRHCKDGVLERRIASEGLVPVPFCPEEHGGLGTPRPSSWIESSSAASVLDGRDRVVSVNGEDVTPQFLKGAQGALELCRRLGLMRAFLKERSPSCGTCQTHVDGKLVDGPGVTTELLRQNGIEVNAVEGRRE